MRHESEAVEFEVLSILTKALPEHADIKIVANEGDRTFDIDWPYPTPERKGKRSRMTRLTVREEIFDDGTPSDVKALSGRLTPFVKKKMEGFDFDHTSGYATPAPIIYWFHFPPSFHVPTSRTSPAIQHRQERTDPKGSPGELERLLAAGGLGELASPRWSVESSTQWAQHRERRRLLALQHLTAADVTCIRRQKKYESPHSTPVATQSPTPPGHRPPSNGR